MIKFFKSVAQEMKMVTWPSAKQNRHDTAIVITSSILFAAYLGEEEKPLSRGFFVYLN